LGGDTPATDAVSSQLRQLTIVKMIIQVAGQTVAIDDRTGPQAGTLIRMHLGNKSLGERTEECRA